MVVVPAPLESLQFALAIITGGVLVWFAFVTTWALGRRSWRSAGPGWTILALLVAVVGSLAVTQCALLFDALMSQVLGSGVFAGVASAAMLFGGYTGAIIALARNRRVRTGGLVPLIGAVSAIGAAAHWGGYLSLDIEVFGWVALVAWPVGWLLCATVIGLLDRRTSVSPELGVAGHI